MSSLAAYLATAKGDRSIDEIAKRATDAGFQISRSVVAKYLRGEHGPRPPERTLEGLAAGFGVDVRKLRVLAGRPAGEQGAYTPIPESASLTQEQRKALDELIRVIVSGRSRNDVADQDQKIVKLGHRRPQYTGGLLQEDAADDVTSDTSHEQGGRLD